MTDLDRKQYEALSHQIGASIGAVTSFVVMAVGLLFVTDWQLAQPIQPSMS